MSLDVYIFHDANMLGELFHANITYNLNKMADMVGIYKELWYPEELKITKPSQLIIPLTKGLQELKNYPEKYLPLNPLNGWGTYGWLVEFLEKYLEACKKFPTGFVVISR